MDDLEKKFYEAAALEVSENRVDTALMAKAWSDADGDKNKSVARYISYRVEELRQEWERERNSQIAAQKEARTREEIIRNKGKVPHSGFSIFLEVVVFGCIIWVIVSLVGHTIAISKQDFSAFRGTPEIIGGLLGLIVPLWIARRLIRYLRGTVYRSDEEAQRILDSVNKSKDGSNSP